MNWGSVKVSNYIVAKLIQKIYPEKAIIASNSSIGGFSQDTIHRKIGTGNVAAPCFDAEFWGPAGAFAGATTDATNGVTQNIILSSEHDALQVEGWLIPDWVLDSGLPGTAALKSIVTDPLFDSNWGSTPPVGLVTAINNVIASNPGFGNFYAAPTSWGHSFETQSAFDALGINVTVQYPVDGNDYGYTDFLSILQTKGSQPDTVTGDNLFWGFSWIPNWSGTFGTTFVWSTAPQNVKVKKLKGPLFESQFPAATAMYDAVKFTSSDIAEFAYDTELSGMTTVEAGDKWLAANTTRTAAWVEATTIVTQGRIQAMETTITDLQARLVVLAPTFLPYAAGSAQAGVLSPTGLDTNLADVNSETLKTMPVRLGAFGVSYWASKLPTSYAAAGSPTTDRVWRWAELMAAGAPCNFNFPFALSDDSWIGGGGALVQIAWDAIPVGFNYTNYSKYEYLLGRWAPGATTPGRTDGVDPTATTYVSNVFVAGFTHETGGPGSAADPYDMISTTGIGAYKIDAAPNNNYAGIHRDGHLAGLMYNQSLGDFEMTFDAECKSLMQHYDTPLTLNVGWSHPVVGLIGRSKHSSFDRRHFMGDSFRIDLGGTITGSTLTSNYQTLSIDTLSGGVGHSVGDILTFSDPEVDGTQWVLLGQTKPANGRDLSSIATYLADGIANKWIPSEGVAMIAPREWDPNRNDGKLGDGVGTLLHTDYISVSGLGYFGPKVGDAFKVRVSSVDSNGAITGSEIYDVGSLYKSSPTSIVDISGSGTSISDIYFVITATKIGPIRYPSQSSLTELGDLYSPPGTIVLNKNISYKVQIVRHPTRPGVNVKLWMKNQTDASYIRVSWIDPLNKDIPTDTFPIIGAHTFEPGQTVNCSFAMKNFVGTEGGFSGFIVGSGVNFGITNWKVGPALV